MLPWRRRVAWGERVSTGVGEGYSTDHLAKRDRALGAATDQEGVHPVERRREAVLEAGQERDVHDEPHQPPEEARKPDPLEAHHGVEARDGRHAAEVPVVERRRFLAPEPSLDRVGGMDPRLHGDLGDARKVLQRHHVSDRENLGVSRDGTVREHLDTSSAIGSRSVMS